MRDPRFTESVVRCRRKMRAGAMFARACIFDRLKPKWMMLSDVQYCCACFNPVSEDSWARWSGSNNYP